MHLLLLTKSIYGSFILLLKKNKINKIESAFRKTWILFMKKPDYFDDQRPFLFQLPTSQFHNSHLQSNTWTVQQNPD